MNAGPENKYSFRYNFLRRGWDGSRLRPEAIPIVLPSETNLKYIGLHFGSLKDSNHGIDENGLADMLL